jgi:hypothetical protein
MEEIRVFVERLGSQKYDEISNEVACEKEHQNDSGDGDDELFPDGRGPVSIEATGEGIHGNKEQAAVQSARGINRERWVFKGRVAQKRNRWREWRDSRM